MKKYNLTNGLFAALLLASPMAGAETKYPAADFQPEIVYQDEEYIGKQKSQPAAAAPTSKATSSAAGSSQAGSKYPAADFQPEIVFQDAEQIAKVGRAAAAASTGSATAPSGSAGPGPAEGATGGLMESYWAGLVAFALAGFAVLYSKRPKPEGGAAGESPVYTIDPSGLTGVARYVRMKNMAAPTGVQKYLEKHVKEFTGVEKYLRQRG